MPGLNAHTRTTQRERDRRGKRRGLRVRGEGGSHAMPDSRWKLEKGESAVVARTAEALADGDGCGLAAIACVPCERRVTAPWSARLPDYPTARVPAMPRRARKVHRPRSFLRAHLVEIEPRFTYVLSLSYVLLSGNSRRIFTMCKPPSYVVMKISAQFPLNGDWFDEKFVLLLHPTPP